MPARRHHYVPQCYLKGFCRHRDKPKLFVVDVKQLKTFSTPPANVATERDFHAVEIEGVPTDALENSFAEFESDLSRSLERIITARSLAEEADRANLLELVAVIAVKNPRHREAFRQFEEQVMKRVLQLATTTPERWASEMKKAKEAGFISNDADADYERMRDFVEKDEFKISLSTGHHLSLELPAIDNVLPLMFERKWMLLRVPRNTTGFVTSDYPACLMWSDPELRRGFHSPGHRLLGTQLVFPISNELAMIGAFEIESEERDADQSLIAQVNTAVIAHSERQVYARDGEFLYLSPHRAKIMRGVEIVGDRLLTERHRGASRARRTRPAESRRGVTRPESGTT
jgi:hypothetical protein